MLSNDAQQQHYVLTSTRARGLVWAVLCLAERLKGCVQVSLCELTENATGQSSKLALKQVHRVDETEVKQQAAQANAPYMTRSARIFNSTEAKPRALKSLAREGVIHALMQQPNIIKQLGYIPSQFERAGQFGILLEYCPVFSGEPCWGSASQAHMSYSTS